MRERIRVNYWAFMVLLLGLMPKLSAGQEKDTTVTSKNLGKLFILVVPFSPQMYSAIGDQFICGKSGISAGQLSDMMRRSFTSTLIYNLNDYYNAVQPEDNLADHNSDISILYQILKYKTIRKKMKAYAKGYPPFSLWQILGPAYARWGSDCINDQRQIPDRHRHKFVNAQIIKDKDSIYSSILNGHDALFALFITDFEMTTRFKTCVDLQDNVFQRDIYVHYTLLDYNGNYIDGGVVGTTYQSSTNDVKKIIDHNLGMLSGMIIANIRNKIAVQ